VHRFKQHWRRRWSWLRISQFPFTHNTVLRALFCPFALVAPSFRKCVSRSAGSPHSVRCSTQHVNTRAPYKNSFCTPTALPLRKLSYTTFPLNAITAWRVLSSFCEKQNPSFGRNPRGQFFHAGASAASPIPFSPIPNSMMPPNHRPYSSGSGITLLLCSTGQKTNCFVQNNNVPCERRDSLGCIPQSRASFLCRSNRQGLHDLALSLS